MRKRLVVLLALLALVFGYLSLYNATNWGISLGQSACLAQGEQGNTALAGSVKEEVAARKVGTQAFAVLTVVSAIACGVVLGRKKKEVGE
ncbi:MAG: hypothetical protein ABSC29_00150 [Minisyncoccia bacterium]|jgi:hypothetical protein